MYHIKLQALCKEISITIMTCYVIATRSFGNSTVVRLAATASPGRLLDAAACARAGAGTSFS